MGKRIICGCVVLGIVACLIGCQKSDNYELMKESKQQVLPIYEKKDAEVQGEKCALETLQDKLDGVDIRKLSKKESAFIRNQKIGFVFQAYHLIPELNALENLVVPLGYAGMRKKEREKIAYELLTEFGIEDLEKKHVSQMSGGEQQRIAIMRAIINKPQILLADEPTGNLDKENSQTIMNLFERLNKQGMTIVMVTHDTSLAKYGTRVVRVEDGRIIEKGKEILK